MGSFFCCRVYLLFHIRCTWIALLCARRCSDHGMNQGSHSVVHTLCRRMDAACRDAQRCEPPSARAVLGTCSEHSCTCVAFQSCTANLHLIVIESLTITCTKIVTTGDFVLRRCHDILIFHTACNTSSIHFHMCTQKCHWCFDGVMLEQRLVYIVPVHHGAIRQVLNHLTGRGRIGAQDAVERVTS